MRTAVTLLVSVGLAGAPLRAATLRLVERAETDATHVRGGGAPDNVGDMLTFTNPVFDQANTVRLGSDQGFCVRLVVGRTYECHLTVLLAGGEIVVDGPFYDSAGSMMAVTGGTGAYMGARGEMALHARDARGTAFDFVFELSGVVPPR